ncbi:serine/threonine-protein kinase [Streptomyces sp. NPDC001089]
MLLGRGTVTGRGVGSCGRRRPQRGLDSADIATVHDAAVTGDTHWLVMQLVDGATLGMVLGEQEQLEVASATAVAAQICSGLDAAHAAGLVHRDLKPENVMARRDGVVKILDFGLVKLMADDGPRLTATGEQPGNLLYASPELLSGDPDLDGRSDLYSVGCLLHHMLVGAPPFPRDRPMAVLRGHLHDTPPGLAEAGVPVPDALQDLVLALPAKDREDRPASADEVYGVLGPWLPGARPGPDTLRGFGPDDPPSAPGGSRADRPPGSPPRPPAVTPAEPRRTGTAEPRRTGTGGPRRTGTGARRRRHAGPLPDAPAHPATTIASTGAPAAS